MLSREKKYDNIKEKEKNDYLVDLENSKIDNFKLEDEV